MKDRRELNVHDLDEVSVEHPVVVRHRGGHTSYYNSRAFAMAGVTKDTKDVPGGTYDREPGGGLSGRVTDRARAVFNTVGTRPTYTADDAMALSQPYPGITPAYTGNVTETQDELNAWVERMHRAGIQVNCHTNGDVAIDMYLKAFERAQQLVPRADARPKITHCTLVNPSLVARIKALGAVPAMFTTYAYYNSDKFVFYGEELMTRCMAFKSMLDAGIHAAAGSDFSPGPFAPLMGIQGMVTRTGWDGKTWGANQRLTVEEAIRVNTLNGAYASKEETLKGSITPGKLADFVVLSDDPHTVNPEKIKDIQIVRTVVGGDVKYQA